MDFLVLVRFFHNANAKILKDKLLTKWEKVGENGTKW
jgi:hypothetical protein